MITCEIFENGKFCFSSLFTYACMRACMRKQTHTCTFIFLCYVLIVDVIGLSDVVMYCNEAVFSLVYFSLIY